MSLPYDYTQSRPRLNPFLIRAFGKPRHARVIAAHGGVLIPF